MKKNLRYYLFIAALMMVVSVSAQVWAQEPVATMQSTSAMVGSGSSLPSAAIGGAYMAVSPGEASAPARTPRRAAAKDDDDTPPSDPHGPYEDPVGAMPWVLMVMMAAGYAAWRKRSAELGNRAE